MADLTTDYDKERLMQLVDARCNGALDEQGANELQALLAASPSACAEYWSALKIHASLEWELSSSENWESSAERLLGRMQTLDSTIDECSDTFAGRRKRAFFFRIGLPVALAACLLVGIFIGVQGPWPQFATKEPITPKSSVPNVPAADAVVGSLTSLIPNSRWSFGIRSDRDSPNVCLGDTLSIDVGAVALRLRNNVVAQMKAPLILQLISVDHVLLLHGRIQVDVPKGAEGFSVETATAEIRDLGTSFSVEVVDGSTDVVVHKGAIDLEFAGATVEDQQPAAAIKRFYGGEAVRVHVDGTLSRIVNVQAADMLTSDAVQSDKSLVASVRDNIFRDGMWSFYEIVPGGLAEDVKAFVDRPHEWNGATAEGLPDYLVGADYIKTFNDDKITPDLVIELELRGPAEVYVFLDKRLTPPSWLVEQFSETGDIVGIDESRNEQTDPTQVGPGVGINQTLSVWRLVAEHGGVVYLGPNGGPPPHEPAEVIYVPSNMYGIAVVGIAGNIE